LSIEYQRYLYENKYVCINPGIFTTILAPIFNQGFMYNPSLGLGQVLLKNKRINIKLELLSSLFGDLDVMDIFFTPNTTVDIFLIKKYINISIGVSLPKTIILNDEVSVSGGLSVYPSFSLGYGIKY